MNQQDVIQTLLTRTSIRSYSDKKVEKEQVELLLRAAMAAPSAKNKQPWEFVVVTEKTLLNELADKMPYGKMIAHAQLAIVACADVSEGYEGEDQNYWTQDVAAATENLLIAAHAMGLGAVWTGVFPRSERVDNVRTILHLPQYIMPLNVIPIGYPLEDKKPKEKWNPDKVHYNGF